MQRSRPQTIPASALRPQPGLLLAWLALLVFVVVSAFPIWWMVRTALTPAANIFDHPGSLLPVNPTLVNLERVMGLLSLNQAQQAGGSGASLNFLLYLRNTLIVMVFTVFGQVMCSTLAAYAFARLCFPLRDAVFTAYLAMLMVPGIVTLIPNFILIKDLGWLNTFQGIVAPFFFFAPVSIFFMRQYFLGIPGELEEAARLDGASIFITFWRIILPIAAPAVGTLVLINVLGVWGEFLWPLLVGRSEETRTITVGLSVFRQQSPSGLPDFTGLMAASLIAMVPVFVLLLALGRRMLDTLGGFTGVK